MFSERLGGIYTALEEKYYAVLDFFDEKGIPVYTYNDFLEEKGLPAFPVTIALIVLLLAAIYGLAFVGNSVDPQINVSFADQFGDSVSGVTVSVKDSGGRIIKSPEKVSSGETITLQGIALGTTLTIIAEKNGFDTTEQTVDVTKQSISAGVSMQRQVTAIVGEMQLVDSDTGDPIRNALVTAEWKDSTKSDTSDSEGKVSFAGIPSNTDVLVSIQADGYETLEENYSFFDDELKEVSLVANSASLLGNSSLIVSVLDEEGNPVNQAKITVWDRETDTSIEEKTIDESETLFSIAKGTSVRLIVQKDGFLRYDSLDFDEGRTLRQDEELWPVVLEKGGTRLVVSVFAGATPLSDATVQLFDLEGNLIEYAITGFGGTVDFSNLEPKEYYITGYKQGYLPLRSKVNVAGTETASLAIEPADSTNSSYVGISVLDSYKAMANNADLIFKETVAGEQLPLGIPPLKTDASGYASIIAKTGSVVFVEAIKEMQLGFDEKLVEANKDNQLVIELSKPLDVIELQVLGPDGTAAEGYAIIESVAGELLFDGEISEGAIFFDSEGNKDIVVKVETLEGETFSQRVSIEGKETVQINLAEAATGIAPTITFTGVFNEIDEETEGIVAGQEYWLGFQASWPTGVEKGGIHIRIGLDGIAFVDSQEAGITGFKATTTDYFYGESYQPLPSPGNETADLQNIGQPGQLNKLLELHFEEPENTIAFKVRVKAQNQISEDEIELHYRAWSEAGGKYFRTPVDSELGEESFSETKTSLYAATEKAVVKVFRSEAECEQELCGNYFFVLPNGLYVDRQDFKAVTEELYALEIDLSAKKPLNVTLNLNTDKANPKLQFTGYDVDEFIDQEAQDSLPAETDLSGQGYLDWPLGNEELQSSSNPLGFRQGSESTSITITGLGVSPERSRKVRAYFTATEDGLAEIKMQAVAESVLEETFPFQIERNKQLLVSVSPRQPGVGEPFTIRVLDGEDGSPVQEASVQIKDVKGSLVDSVAGRGSTRRGLAGEYYFKNSLEPGLYTIAVSAAGYVSDEFEIAIARNDVLQVKSPVRIEISKEQREETVSISMHNSTAEEIKELGYEIGKEAGFPEEFSVSVSMPASVSASQDAVATVHVLVNLDGDSEDNLYGEAKLVLHGMVAGNYPTKSETTLRISYNKPLDPDCLYFDKQHLIVKLMGRPGSSATEEFEVENNCDTALNLRAKVDAMQEDPNLTVTVAPLRIERDAIEKVKVTISNRIERMYDLQSRRDYKITFESSQIAKTIPLSVELWNPRTNLSYPPNLSLWMVRSAAEELAYAQSPLQVLNNGSVPITGFDVAVTPEAYMQGITTGLKPLGVMGMSLYPGMPLTPQRFVYAQSTRTEALARPGQGWIQFYGTVNGRRYPDLGRASLTVNYSGTKCLTATAVDSLVFSSKQASQGTLERTIRIRNECGEEVRISGNTAPKEVSGNTFVVSPSGGSMALMPGQEQGFKLILLKGQETNRTATIKVLGLLTRQNKWIKSNELQVTLKLGEQVATSEGKATSAMSIDKCLESGTKELAFPILSSDCGEGYCDAKQLSEYITAKADNALKMVEDKARRNKYNANEFGNCAEKEFCDFERMGIIIDRFPVYLQLDSMTDKVLRNTLKQQSKTELESYDVRQGSKSIEDIGTIGFEFGNIYLGGNFRGCGKYYVEIIGAVRVVSGDITIQEGTRNFVLSINVSDRKTTNECYHRVENVANFLPVDQGYTLKQHFKAWPGLVKADSQLEELAKEFAKELFGKADGRYSTSIAASSNKLEIIKGNTGNGLLKIRITKAPIGETNNPDQPKTVFAHIPDNYTAENTNMTTEIAKAFRTFKESSFEGKDACWGEDNTGQYIIMKTYTDMEKLHGKLEIKSEEKAIRINNQRQCIDLNITSKSPEKTWFSTDFLNEEKKPKADGIEYVEIVDLEGEVLLKENANGTGSADGTKHELQLVKDKKLGSGVYVGEFRFCVKGDEKFPLALETLKSISITGYGTAFGAEKARKTEPPYSIELQVCGIHPKEFVEKVIEREKNMENNSEETYFVMLGWKGSPEPPKTLNLSKFRRMLSLQAEIEELGPSGFGAPISGLSSYEKKMMPYRLGSIWAAYFATCAPTAFFMPGGSPTFDCLLPAIWASLNVQEDAKAVKEIAVESVKKVLGPLGNATIAPMVNAVSRLLGGEGEWKVFAEEELEEYVGEDLYEQQFQTLLKSAATFSGTKTTLEALGAVGTKATLTSSRNLVGSKLWDNFADDFVEKTKYLEGLSDASANALKKELSEKAKEAAIEELFEKGPPGVKPSQWHLTSLKPGVKGKPLDEIAKKALDTSFEKSQKNIDEIIAPIVTNPTAGEAEALKQMIKQRTGSIFDTRAIADDALKGMEGESVQRLAAGTNQEIRETMARKIISSFEKQDREMMESIWESFGGRKEFEEKVIESVKNQQFRKPALTKNLKNTYDEILDSAARLRGVPKGSIKLNVDEALKILSGPDQAKYLARLQSNVDGLVRSSMVDFSSVHKVKIYEGLHKTVNTGVMKKMTGDYADDMAKFLKGNVKKPGAWTRFKNFLKGAGWGIFSGFAANGVGMASHWAYWKGVPPVESQASFMTSDLTKVLDEEGNVIGEKEIWVDLEIEKHQPYKFVIRKNLEGKIFLKMTPIKTKEQFEEMAEAFEKNPESNWNIDCTNYAKEKIKLLLGGLNPKPEETEKPEHALAYHNNQEIIRYFSDQYGIREELIMAVLIEQPEKIKACDIDADWHTKNLDEEERSRLIGCATKRLNEALEQNKPLSSFSDAKDKAGYVKKITEIQKTWAKFRVEES